MERNLIDRENKIDILQRNEKENKFALKQSKDRIR